MAHESQKSLESFYHFVPHDRVLYNQYSVYKQLKHYLQEQQKVESEKNNDECDEDDDEDCESNDDKESQLPKKPQPMIWEPNRLSKLVNNIQGWNECKNSDLKHIGDWVRLGSTILWDCVEPLVAFQTDSRIIKSINTCDPRIFCKCWVHRYVDNNYCYW